MSTIPEKKTWITDPASKFFPVKKPEEHRCNKSASRHATVSKADLWGQNPVLIHSCTYFLQSKPVLAAAELNSGIPVAANSTVTRHTGARAPNPISPCALPAPGCGGKGQPGTAATRVEVSFLARPGLTKWLTQKAGGFPAFCGIHLHWPVHWHWLGDIPITLLSVLKGTPLSQAPLSFTQCNPDFLSPWAGQKL